MQVATGTVVNGKIVAEGVSLTEGAVVAVGTRGADRELLPHGDAGKRAPGRHGRDRAGRVCNPRRFAAVVAKARLSMVLRIKISLRAAGQVRKAAEWWAQNRPAAPRGDLRRLR